MDKRLTLGSLEKVSLPELGAKDILAKVDTGAFSGALHCTDIHKKDDVLYFTPLGDESLTTSTTDFEEGIVRSANGVAAARYRIPVTIEVDGAPYETVIGLSDRALLQREMLLGRRFLLEHNAIVDVSLTKDLDVEAEKFMEGEL